MKLKKLSFIILFQLLVVCSISQTITDAEYFFDIDPGPGNGVLIEIADGDLINKDLNFSTTGLTKGFHYLFVRVKDNNGQWSNAIQHKFYLYEETVPEELPIAKPLVKAEYFFDTDPGIGNGIPILITRSNDLDINRCFSTVGLESGNHILFIRVMDEYEKWSIADSTAFSIYDVECVVPVTIFNADTVSVGSETSFTNQSTNVDEATSFSWDLLNDNTEDYTSKDVSHTFAEAGRYDVKLTANNGDQCFSSIIKEIVVGTLPNSQITIDGDTEFCFGNTITLTAEPGHTYLWSSGETTQSIEKGKTGNYYCWITNSEGIEIRSEVISVVVNNVPEVELITTNSTDGIANGSALVNISGGSEDYTIDWSTEENNYIVNDLSAGDYSVTISDGFCPQTNDFTITNIASPENAIVEAEYYFDADPGIGEGNPINISGELDIDYHMNFSIEGLEKGFHYLYIRMKDKDERWSIAKKHKFYIYDISVPEDPMVSASIEEAEYFLGTDPGIDNGITISLTENNTIDENLLLDISAMAAGTYNLSVRVKDTNNIWSIATVKSFEILDCDFPEQPGIPSGETTLCINNENTEYTISASEFATSYEWEIIPEEAGIITGTSITAAVNWSETFTGSAEISVKSINDCTESSFSDKLNVTVSNLPVALIAPVSSICSGETVSLVASGGTSFLWSTSETSNSISVTPLETTNYSVTVTENSCSTNTQVEVTVNPKYDIQVEEFICEGDSVLWEGNYYKEEGAFDSVFTTISGCDSIRNLILSITHDYFIQEEENICDGETFQWQGNDYTTGGTFYANYTSINDCDSIYELSLVVGEDYLFEITETICEGETYNWQGNNYTNAGDYAANYESVFACDSIYTLNLSVIPLPAANFTFSANNLEVSFTNTSENASSYSWKFGDEITSTEENPVHTFATSGNFNVVLTALSTNCGDDTHSELVDIVTGLNSTVFEDIGKIYPNPTNGKLYFELNDVINNELKIQIIDINGQQIYNLTNLSRNVEEIDLSDLAKGIYYFKVMNNEFVKIEKFMIK
jgi:PKD repeat protein